MIEKKDRKFVLCLVLLALATRLVIAPLYVSPPGQAYSTEPHDFPHYMATADTILEGRTLYVDRTHTDNSPSPYGPLYALSWAGWIDAFGRDYTLFKIPSIIYDVLTAVLVFYVAKSLFSRDSAKYASLIYVFSFIPILMSGADGADENPLMFFLLLSVFLLVKYKPSMRLSAVSLGVALLFKLSLAAIFIPVIMYYLSQQKLHKRILPYIAITAVTVALVTLPFFIKAGMNVFIQISYASGHDVTGTTLLSAVKMVVNYFTLGMSSAYNDNPAVQSLARPFTIMSFVGATAYVLKFGMKDKRIELMRNIFIFILLFTVFGSVGEWHIFVWLIPYLVILFAYQNKLKFSLSRLEILGFAMVFVSTILYAALYRETKIPEYALWQQALLMASVLLASAGTYMSLIRFKLKTAWSLSTLAWAWWLTNHAKLLMVFAAILPLFKNPLWAYGIQDFSSIIMITISSLFLLVSFHKIAAKDGYSSSLEKIKSLYRGQIKL